MSELVKVGTYHGRGISYDHGTVQNEKKTPYVRVALKIIGGEFEGRVVARDLFLSDKATEHSIKALRTLGCSFPGNDITNFEGFGSKEVSFTVEHESYQDKETQEQKIIPKVGFINSLAGGIRPAAQMTDAQKAELKQRLMGAVAASAGRPVTGNKAGGTPPPF